MDGIEGQVASKYLYINPKLGFLLFLLCAVVCLFLESIAWQYFNEGIVNAAGFATAGILGLLFVIFTPLLVCSVRREILLTGYSITIQDKRTFLSILPNCSTSYTWSDVAAWQVSKLLVSFSWRDLFSIDFLVNKDGRDRIYRIRGDRIIHNGMKIEFLACTQLFSQFFDFVLENPDAFTALRKQNIYFAYVVLFLDILLMAATLYLYGNILNSDSDQTGGRILLVGIVGFVLIGVGWLSLKDAKKTGNSKLVVTTKDRSIIQDEPSTKASYYKESIQDQNDRPAPIANSTHTPENSNRFDKKKGAAQTEMFSEWLSRREKQQKDTTSTTKQGAEES